MSPAPTIRSGHRRATPSKLAQHPHTLVKFHQRDYERQCATRHLGRVMHHVAVHGAPAAGHLVLDRSLFVLPDRGHRRMLQRTVRALLQPQFVGRHTLPEVGAVPRPGRPHEFRRVQIFGNVRRLLGTRPELHDAPVHLVDELVAHMPLGVDIDEPALAQRRLLGPEDLGHLIGGGDLLTQLQITVIDLLVVGGDHRLVARGIEKCHHPSQRVIPGAFSIQPGHGPYLRHCGRCDDSGMPGCFRGLLVDVDWVAIAHRLDPVVDHRLVHRIPC